MSARMHVAPGDFGENENGSQIIKDRPFYHSSGHAVAYPLKLAGKN